MSTENQKEELIEKIGAQIEQFKKMGAGKITQSNLAKLLKVNTVTLSRAKSTYYQISLNTLHDLEEKLESLLQDFQKDPETFLNQLSKSNENISSDDLLEKVIQIAEKLENVTSTLDERTKVLLEVDEDKELENEGRGVLSYLKTNRSYFFLISFISLSLFGLISWYFFIFGKQSDFKITFESNSIQSFLKQNSFIIDHPNYDYISLEEGKLKTHTLEGDNWLDRRYKEEAIIPNLIVKKIKCIECEVFLTIQNFRPNQPWQQAGLIFFDKEARGFHNQRFVRFTYTHELVKRSPLGDNSACALQIVEKTQADEVPSSKTINIGKKLKAYSKELFLRVVIDKENYSFFWTNQDGMGYQKIHTIPRVTEPKYIGIASFQGFTFDNGSPLNADTIPVYIDNLVVRPLRK